MEMPTRGAKMSKEARKATVFSCEYSEQNPVYCQQCGGHEHLCRKRLNTEGLTAYFDQMATDGRVETTVQWLVEISLLTQSDVEKRLKHVHAEHSTAIRKAAEAVIEHFYTYRNCECGVPVSMHGVITSCCLSSNGSAELSALKGALSRGWLSRSKAALEGK